MGHRHIVQITILLSTKEKYFNENVIKVLFPPPTNSLWKKSLKTNNNKRMPTHSLVLHTKTCLYGYPCGGLDNIVLTYSQIHYVTVIFIHECFFNTEMELCQAGEILNFVC